MGNDDGTLAHELLYYADPPRSGELYVLNGTDPYVTGEDTTWLGAFDKYRPDPSSIVVAFVSEPDAPHPILDPRANPLGDRRACAAFRKSAPRSDQGVALLEVPTSIRRVRHERVFDLRRPSSQKWLNERARTEIFLTVFAYSEPFPGLIPQDLKSHIPKDYPWVLNFEPLQREEGTVYTENTVTSTALRLGEFDKGTFGDLLPVLVNPGRGGSPITDAIGAMLRSASARGFVYPSARNDIVCRFQGDEVVGHSGWCFVDYSAFKLAFPYYRIITDPVMWCGGDRLQLLTRPADHPEAGSWKLLGLSRATEHWHLYEVDQAAKRNVGRTEL